MLILWIFLGFLYIINNLVITMAVMECYEGNKKWVRAALVVTSVMFGLPIAVITLIVSASYSVIDAIRAGWR